MGVHRTNMRNRLISLLLTAAVLLIMPGYPAYAEAAGRQTVERGTPKNPVHHCTKQNDGTDYTDWSYIYFGSYPQTEVAGDALTAEIVGASYDANGDAEVDGEKYRRISKSDTNNDANFGDSAYRYFKWERIRWRVMQKDDDTLFVMADKGLDCKKYNENNVAITWKECTSRDWLNDSFFRTAFGMEEQGAVVEWDVENVPQHGVEGNVTRDKVYFLSSEEAGSPQYGFCESYGTDSASRYLQPSDYAYAMGAYAFTGDNYTGNCYWMLRSSTTGSNGAAIANFNGNIGIIGTIRYWSNCAVAPVLHIDLSSDLWTTEGDDNEHEHDFTKKILTEEYLENQADCTNAATYHYACSICDLKGTETYEEGVPLGHVLEVTDHGDGTHAKVCQRCSLSTEKEAHRGGSGSCVTKRRCEICNAEYGEFDNTVHGEAEVRDVKAATCAEEGYTGNTYCKACDTKLESGQVIPATGEHTWDDGIETKTPNCTEKGEKEYTCAVCGEKKTEEEGEALGHNLEVADNGDGTHSGTCDRCGLSMEREAHRGGSGSCVTKRRCEICNAEYGEFDNTVHGEAEVRDVKAATCAEEGYTGNTYCKACDTKLETGQIIPATGEHTWDDGKVTKSPSCTQNGEKEYACTACDAKRQELFGKFAHNYETILTKATGFSDGSRVEQCVSCGDIKSEKTILHVGAVALKRTSYTYDGKMKKPSVTVKDADGKVINSRNYTVTYEENRKIGNARVTVLMKGDYAGVIFRTFEIVPAGTSISGKVTARNKGFQVKWKKKKSNVTGYEVQYSTSKKFTKKTTVTRSVKKNSVSKLTVKNLDSGKKYYIRMRTYKTVKGKRFCSAWSKSRSVTTGM